MRQPGRRRKPVEPRSTAARLDGRIARPSFWEVVNMQQRRMILIGQYDSPFVRRVAIAMRRYDIEYEHRPWGVFSHADELARFNPLRRVPTLVLDDEEVLLESSAILDMLDEQVGPERALLPRGGPLRREGLRVIALATGLADKSVSLFYESFLHAMPAANWLERCKTQLAQTLDALEAARTWRDSEWWLGDGLGHPDIAVACAVCHLREAHPEIFDPSRWPSVAQHCARAEALADFRAIYQPFVVRLAE
jgi:glutathione S-transferase